jgi:hypothetical protein
MLERDGKTILALARSEYSNAAVQNIRDSSNMHCNARGYACTVATGELMSRL